jgi:2-polyprenyl-3-methyl-5-hydroxy-6-metoxy-1,4-benzoquinol methylase
MSEINTLLHLAAFNNLVFDMPYYYEICKGKKIVELCAGFGRVCNRLSALGIDIHAIELNKFNFQFIDLPINKAINKSIFSCHDLESSFDVVIAPFNSLPMFNHINDANAFFALIAKILKPSGFASLSYYHPDSWRTIPSNETAIKIGNVHYEYTSDFDLTERISKRGIWRDIFKRKDDGKIASISNYNLRIYENEKDVNDICSKFGLICTDMIRDFYNEKEYEPGWVEYKISKDVKVI